MDNLTENPNNIGTPGKITITNKIEYKESDM